MGGWTVDSNSIFSGTKDTSGFTNGGITIFSGGSIHSKEFVIDTNGNATFKGTVQIGSTDLTADNTLNSNTSASDVSGLSDAATTTVSSIRSGTSKSDVGLSNLSNPSSALTPISASQVNTNVTSISGGAITTGSITATVMQATTIYANRLEGDVNVIVPFRKTQSTFFRGNTATGGGTKILHTVTLPATTHLSTGHKPFASVTGSYDSTNGKTYTFKLFMRLGSGSYQEVGQTRFKANTNLYAQFAVSGGLTDTITTSTVGLKLEVTRTGSSGVTDNDNSTTQDEVYEVSGFILGAR